MMTQYGVDLNDAAVNRGISSLINKFYKILPLRENNEATLKQYMRGLQRELLGGASLLPELSDDGQFLAILSILQFMIDNDCDVDTVRSDVFKVINLLKRLKIDEINGGEMRSGGRMDHIHKPNGSIRWDAARSQRP